MNPLYAAALQDHITTKYSLTTKKRSSGLSSRQKQLLKWSKSTKSAPKKENAIKSQAFTEKYLDSIPSTLAQRLGEPGQLFSI